MSTSIVLRLGQGNFESDGFPVSLQILKNGQLIHQEIDGYRMPAAPELPGRYDFFRERYRRLGEMRGLEMVQGQLTHGSSQEYIDTCREAIAVLEAELDRWFNHSSFQTLKNKILAKTASVPSNETVPIVIDADTGEDNQNAQLQKLFWHRWPLFTENHHLEPVLSATIDTPVTALTGAIKILAVFGSSEGGLELSSDETALNHLRRLGADVHISNQPTRQAIHDLFWDRTWDILFFAGHSDSNQACTRGHLQLSDDQTVPISNLREDLNRAVGRGLKLAIFNSCDGLGIAHELKKVKVPSIIVMREPVPDRVARKFLAYFLRDLSQGRSLYKAMQETRRRLVAMEYDHRHPCPAANYLPIVFQNPNQPELAWLDQPTDSIPPREEPVEPEPSFPQQPLPDSPPRPVSWRKIALLGLGILLLAALGYCTQQKLSSPSKPVSESLMVTPIAEPRYSLGERLLFSDVTTPEKQRGIQAFARGDYAAAKVAFEQSRKTAPNDPETLIYLNNAIARLSSTQRRIAVSVPIGTNPNVASEILRGVAQAQNQVNNDSKGINGAKLEIIVADDRNDPILAKKIAQKFVDDGKILAVIGHNASNASGPAAPIYNQNRLVMITPTSYAENIAGYGDYIFQTVPAVDMFPKLLANYIVKTVQIRKVAICSDRQAQDGEAFRKQLEVSLQQIGSKIVKTTGCDEIGSDQFNADEALKEAGIQGAQGLVIIPYIDRIEKATALAEANANRARLPLFGSPTFYTKKTLEVGEAIKGLTFPATWHPDAYPNSAFLREAEKLWGTRVVNWRTATSYDAAISLISVLGQNPSRLGIQKALVNAKPVEGAEGVHQKVVFDKNRVRNLPIQMIQVQPQSPSPSGTGFEFVLLNKPDRSP